MGYFTTLSETPFDISLYDAVLSQNMIRGIEGVVWWVRG